MKIPYGRQAVIWYLRALMESAATPSELTLTQSDKTVPKTGVQTDGALAALAARAKVSLCLQCRKCASGCPLSGEMDYPPNRIVRLVQLGQKETLLASRAIWLCTSCHTCSTRCPAGVDPCAVQDGLRHLSTREGRTPSDPKAAASAEAFLWSVQKSGRTDELRLAARYKRKTRTYFDMFFLGITMLLKGKLKLFRRKHRSRRQVAALVKRHLRIGQTKD